MLAEITWPLFIEWRAYDELDPIGDERADIRSAQQVQIHANLNRGKHQDPYPLSQFVLPFGDYEPPPPPQQDWRAMKRMMLDFSAGQGTPAPPEFCYLGMDAPPPVDHPVGKGPS